MSVIKIVKIREDAIVPARATNEAIGFDVFGLHVLDKCSKEHVQELPIDIPVGGSILIGIGVRFAIPWPWQCEVRPRSGLASRHDIELSNSPGTIDPDFRGEAGILLRNRGDKSFTIKKGMRIAQLIFSKVEIPFFEEAEELPETRRGSGGFGSTGLLGIKEGTGEFKRALREKDIYYMAVVLAVAERSNCIRGVKIIDGKPERDNKGKLVGQKRKFGCVIEKGDNIISHGFNAQHKGSPLCAEVGCLRDAENIPSGTQIEKCRAMHAEWWALANMLTSGLGASTVGATMYVNSEPCEVCAKLIAQTEIDTLVLLEGIYPTNGLPIIKEAGINIRYVDL